MNEKIDIDVKTLKPFTRFIYTIGVLPTSYLMSMTYEEQLVWLCNYLSQTIIPTINNNAEAVKEVQDLVLQLQDYINNYFDNLDVQEEINNKLDEMAEGGELTEIIAQYLQLAGVLAFNTLNDLKGATNIVDGSTTRILGKVTYNDGLGAYYKIRALINTDVIDNDNLVALTNYPTLVAEKIPDVLNTYINNLETRVTELEDDNTKYFVLFGDSWSDFGAGFENWYVKANIDNILNCTLKNFAHGGAGFLVNNNLIDTQIETARTTLTTYEKQHTKYVVIEGGVNDIGEFIFTTNEWQTAVNNAIIKAHEIFPNAMIVYAPDMCSPDLNENRSATCLYQAMYYINNHLPYRECYVKAPKNLPYFWLGHTANEVYRSDNLHLNEFGAYAYGKEILNCLTGSESDRIWKGTLSNATGLNVLLSSNGLMELHGTYTADSASQVVLDNNSRIGEFIGIYKRLMPNRFFVGTNGNVNGFAWINYLGGTNRELYFRPSSGGTYYF
ncbi:MAG: SGNH/GDSL hydrolase family protein [Bacilli bacterium]|nr:SGNH/GDSL hydrolase family protein [Bacilli bacterium]